jgi:hypothetical protein
VNVSVANCYFRRKISNSPVLGEPKSSLRSVIARTGKNGHFRRATNLTGRSFD